MATEEDRIDAGKILTISVVGAAITYALITIASFAYWQMKEAEFRRKNDAPPAALTRYLQAQEDQLNRLSWKDKAAKTVTIPVDLAIKRIAERRGELSEPSPESVTGQD